MAMYGYVWLCRAMYGYVWLCMAMYGYVWLCRAMYGCVCLCRATFILGRKYFVERSIHLIEEHVGLCRAM